MTRLSLALSMTFVTTYGEKWIRNAASPVSR